MTRKKKSRKPSAAPVRLSKQEKQQLAELKDKKPKKQKGKKPGNRQQEARDSKNTPQQAQHNKDPRIGSKKPIALGTTDNEPSAAKPKYKPESSPRVAPIREVNHVDNTAELNKELNNIEQDEALQVILGKQEQDMALTEQEIDYYNQLMDKHQAISEQLGLTDEEEESHQSPKDDDALWDTLDKQDFSDYQ
ncbi:Der GTPase-activating protein YihI [Thalassotalea sp. PP2-459]|uniref:Der GTPase-activating protein YihI n=1 Tax=Thalassotalea sp. PP2-459 TaxID=1742724 RepID=UPI000942EF4C|nr:Der GTPase-activating protein YihI [Thalassotalea sp. PP2-459]OKY25160.1 hypothetical protein BI291_03890 [Thalassotalea sp. PP2-459]